VPYIHAYDPATGEIKGICAASAPEPGRTTPTQEEAWEAAGLVVVAGPSRDPDGNPVSAETHRYQDGALVSKQAPSPAEVLAAAKARQYARASADYERHVAGLGYTAAWQRTAQAQRLALQKVLADPGASEEQKAAAQAAEERFAALEEFLVVTLGLYFAQVGRAIFAAASLDELAQVSWDFSQFDSQDPKVTMHADVFPRLAVAKDKA
jgi:hypothetical protein